MAVYRLVAVRCASSPVFVNCFPSNSYIRFDIIICLHHVATRLRRSKLAADGAAVKVTADGLVPLTGGRRRT
jgi:hypothetical protein